MNECDSDYLSQSLILSGLTPTKDLLNADLIMINTCAVRAKPEQKAYSQIGRLLKMKKKNPNLLIGVMGCVAQKEGGNILNRFPNVNYILGCR